MKVICESCHTTYDLPEGKEGQMGCPYCEHVNPPGLSGQDPVSGHVPQSDLPEELDHSKTMITPMEGEWGEDTSGVQKAVSGKKTSMPVNASLSLVILEGDQKGQRIPLTKSQFTIGRKQADLVLNDPEVSRHHCGLLIFNDLVVVRDLGSANGTLVNNRLVREGILKDGDTFQVGSTVMKLSIQPKS